MSKTANEKRLIDANELTDRLNHTTMVAYPNLFPGLLAAVEIVDDSPTVDAVEVDKYIELREQYDRLFTEFHELRDSFVDYVCSGIPNPSPFCKNKRYGCCDSYGWCKNDDQCTGFNPVEGFSDGERKDHV